MVLTTALVAGLISASIAASVSSDMPTSNGRQIVSLNRSWRCFIGDAPGAEAPWFLDSEWDRIGLPHSASTPYFLSPKFYVGTVWYRKELEVPQSSKGKSLYVQFDGVFQEADVYVNGSHVTNHRGGYTGFVCDISSGVHPGRNVLAVKVNNRWDAQLAPRAGEHVFSAGIYRDVSLIVANPVHFTPNRVHISTPSVDVSSGSVRVMARVENHVKSAKSVRVESRVFTPSGRLVSSIQREVQVAGLGQEDVKLDLPPVENPALWTPETPTLYRVVTTIHEGNELVDRVEQPLGFRWFKWSASEGFFLNGRHYLIRGANVHQDHAGWGDAVTQAGAYRDVKMVKDAGFNFIRGSHYPHSPAFLRACDELGILMWSEFAFWGTGGQQREGGWTASAYPIHAKDEKPFEASVMAQLEESISQQINHPSIVAWSMCNEPFFTGGETFPKVRALLSKMVQRTHELDPSRAAAIGGCQRGDIDKLGDVAGYNGDGAKLFPNPGVANLVTEYGSTITDRPGQYEPGWGDMTGEPEYPWRSGQAIWCAFDHGSLFEGFGRMGIIDYFRLPKRAWYWYRNEYRHINPPVWPKEGTAEALHVTADKMTIEGTDAHDDVHLTVQVVNGTGEAVTSCPKVTLRVVSGPGEFPTGRSIAFESTSDITIRDGACAIEFRSYEGGKTVIEATSPGLKPSQITITTSWLPKYVEGKSVHNTERAYRRYEGPLNAAIERLGIDNPTSASSTSAGHSPRFANDRNASSYWEPAQTEGAWWQVDLERICLVHSVAPDWIQAIGYSVTFSLDGKTWSSEFNGPMTDCPSPVKARFVRIKVSGGGKLRDITIRGVVQ